ncbi:hypothetical protein [Maribacter hydrothermalis]|uniref:Uncharacterized protein n=1 Tax=Maribacter hydrothermalis TaxID=1836467 RepID=A0A1B7Z104_9FLAO|nr:hypothetical protein [Maribacter hydrothermalis]APQ18052.1 hypothetical protein BTR34_12265 [Maribacter hydrothermalis]OBR36397.1 hypothetical protein A9200_08155 [Maribacter hydrothermalis]
MEANKYLNDITEIKNIMNRSSRFISLSGLSGILAGIYALIGASLAYVRLKDFSPTNYDGFAGRNSALWDTALSKDLTLIALAVLVMAAITGFVMTLKKSKKSGEKIWDSTSKRLVYNFLIPLVVGGLFCLVLMQHGAAGLVAPATLIFYGLACVNASKYTMGDVRYMGLAFILIGLISTQFIGYGLYFWALGFGVCHILYGALMYYKYDRD